LVVLEFWTGAGDGTERWHIVEAWDDALEPKSPIVTEDRVARPIPALAP
jgi:hypothetical protein